VGHQTHLPLNRDQIDASVVQSTVGVCTHTLYGSMLTTLDFYQRGYHEITNELVFGSNPGFVFHDSCGFEAGGVDEFKKMKEFILERASTRKLKERIHAIW
jgi:hypothetical protein